MFDPSGQAIHVPQISTRIYGGIPGDHPCGNFLMISLRKFGGNEGEFPMWIFPPHFPVESLGKFPRGNFLCVSLKIFKMQFNDIGRISVMWKYPSDDLMSFFGELKFLQVWRNFPLISTPIWKFPLNFHVDSRFTCNPNFHMDSFHKQKQSPGIPHGSARFCPLGMLSNVLPTWIEGRWIPKSHSAHQGAKAYLMVSNF